MTMGRRNASRRVRNVVARANAMLAAALVAVSAGLVADAGVLVAQDAEVRTWHEEQMADIEQMRDKYVALAEAFPEETYDWRPMEGVRSVREVMALAAAEGFLFPRFWGVEPPEGVQAGFGDEMARLTALSKADLVAEIRRGFDHMLEACAAAAGRGDEEANWFGGRTVTVTSAIGLSAADMHEHLGQSIAYARTNQIVPPWSM